MEHVVKGRLARYVLSPWWSGYKRPDLSLSGQKNRFYGVWPSKFTGSQNHKPGATKLVSTLTKKIGGHEIMVTYSIKQRRGKAYLYHRNNIKKCDGSGGGGGIGGDDEININIDKRSDYGLINFSPRVFDGASWQTVISCMKSTIAMQRMSESIFKICWLTISVWQTNFASLSNVKVLSSILVLWCLFCFPHFTHVTNLYTNS